jgi:hypothetical protein
MISSSCRNLTMLSMSQIRIYIYKLLMIRTSLVGSWSVLIATGVHTIWSSCGICQLCYLPLANSCHLCQYAICHLRFATFIPDCVGFCRHRRQGERKERAHSELPQTPGEYCTEQVRPSSCQRPQRRRKQKQMFPSHHTI